MVALPAVVVAAPAMVVAGVKATNERQSSINNALILIIILQCFPLSLCVLIIKVEICLALMM